MTKTLECPSIAEEQKLSSQNLEKPRVLQTKKRPPNPSRFRFEQVNEVTWKLTNGEITETSASHGQWGSYPNDESTCVGDLRRAQEVVRRAPQVAGPIW
jgi:hypothetical protein